MQSACARKCRGVSVITPAGGRGHRAALSRRNDQSIGVSVTLLDDREAVDRVVHYAAVDLHRIHAPHVRATERGVDAEPAVVGARRAAARQQLGEPHEPAVQNRQLGELLLVDDR